MLLHHLLLNSLNQPMYFNPLFQVENVTNNPQNEMSNFINKVYKTVAENFYVQHCLTCSTGNPDMCVCACVYRSFELLILCVCM